MRLRALLSALALVPMPAFAGPLPAPELIGEIALPTGLSVAGVPFGGLSDLSYDRRTGDFVAISNASGENGPPRLYDLRISVRDGRFAGLDIARMVPLAKDADGVLAQDTMRAGGVAVDTARGGVFWSGEDESTHRPALYFTRDDDASSQPVPLPASFLPDGTALHGVRADRPLDALTLSADGTTLIAASEAALSQDGPEPSFTGQSPLRLLMLNAATGAPVAQYLYYSDTIPARPTKFDGAAQNDLTALAALPDGRLVSVERGYAAGVGNSIRFYVVSLEDASDVSGQDPLALRQDRAVRKVLWFALTPGMTGIPIDDLEGLAFGPDIDGHATLLTASDNNFNRHQATRFKLFTVDLPRQID